MSASLFFVCGAGLATVVLYGLWRQEVRSLSEQLAQANYRLIELHGRAIHWASARDVDAADWAYVETLDALGQHEEARARAALLAYGAERRMARAKTATLSVIRGGKS